MVTTTELLGELYQDFLAIKSGELSISKARARKGTADSIIAIKKVELLASLQNNSLIEPLYLTKNKE
jgi:hypothetical protein